MSDDNGLKLIFHYKGGPGSGHHGHSGRPGKRGGSLPGGSAGGGGDPTKVADNILSTGYNSPSKFGEELDKIHEEGNFPVMEEIDKQWLQILNSPAAYLPPEGTITKLQSGGYGDKNRITVDSRKKYGS